MVLDALKGQNVFIIALKLTQRNESSDYLLRHLGSNHGGIESQVEYALE